MTEQIDFTNCRKVLGKAYNGANGKKIAVEYDREQYMLKFPPSAERKKICCHIPTAAIVNILLVRFSISLEFRHMKQCWEFIR